MAGDNDRSDDLVRKVCTNCFQIRADEYSVHAATTQLIHHEKEVYYVTVNREYFLFNFIHLGVDNIVYCRVRYLSDWRLCTHTDTFDNRLKGAGPTDSAASAVAGYVNDGTFFRLQSSYCEVTRIRIQ